MLSLEASKIVGAGKLEQEVNTLLLSQWINRLMRKTLGCLAKHQRTANGFWWFLLLGPIAMTRPAECLKNFMSCSFSCEVIGSFQSGFCKDVLNFYSQTCQMWRFCLEELALKILRKFFLLIAVSSQQGVFGCWKPEGFFREAADELSEVGLFGSQQWPGKFRSWVGWRSKCKNWDDPGFCKKKMFFLPKKKIPGKKMKKTHHLWSRKYLRRPLSDATFFKANAGSVGFFVWVLRLLTRTLMNFAKLNPIPNK